MKPLVWVSERLSKALVGRLGVDVEHVTSARAFVAAQHDGSTITFVDGASLESLDRMAAELGSPTDPAHASDWRRLHAAVSAGSMIAVSDVPRATMVGWLPSRPWLSHVVSTEMLDSAIGAIHLANVIELCRSRDPKLLDWLRPATNARRVHLTHAKSIEERLDRMSQFFASQSVDGNRVEQMRKATDELLVNAFYAAPVAAGASRPIERSRDVALPDELACDIAYGCLDEHAIVRVRDPFGALSRERFVEALTRRRNPSAKETGLARVAAAASIFAVSVVQNRYTEILVAIPMRAGDGTAFAIHFANRTGPKPYMWKLVSEDTGDAAMGASIALAATDDA